MSEQKFTMTPAVETALASLVAQSKISRLSTGLRNLLLEYFLALGWDRPYWYLELIEDLLPLFTFFDQVQNCLDPFYQFRYPEEEQDAAT